MYFIFLILALSAARVLGHFQSPAGKLDHSGVASKCFKVAYWTEVQNAPALERPGPDRELKVGTTISRNGPKTKGNR